MHGPAIGHVSVNVSGHQVVGPAFAETVAAVLAETGTDPASVFLEVTESAFFEDAARTVAGAARGEAARGRADHGRLRDWGHSLLNYLRRFPFDMVKIDRSFVVDLTEDSATPSTGRRSSTWCTYSTWTSSSPMGWRPEAELDQVIDLGIDRAQGYAASAHRCFRTSPSGRSSCSCWGVCAFTSRPATALRPRAPEPTRTAPEAVGPSVFRPQFWGIPFSHAA